MRLSVPRFVLVSAALLAPPGPVARADSTD
jgi:hypothetical protein